MKRERWEWLGEEERLGMTAIGNLVVGRRVHKWRRRARSDDGIGKIIVGSGSVFTLRSEIDNVAYSFPTDLRASEGYVMYNLEW